MMNSRNVKEPHHRRGHSFNGFPTSHHFSNTNSSRVSGKLPKLSFESARVATSEIDDLLSSSEGGKHDYDWLLTPPGTPHLASSGGESLPTLVLPRSSLGRSASNTNASRLSVSQSEKNNHTHCRATRSSSVTRTSNKSSSIPNTPPSQVSSHTITRSPSASRPSTPSTRATASRPSTPSRIPRSLPTPTNTDINKTRTPQCSRPSTPTSGSRPHIPANLHSPSRSFSRPSTPNRRHSMPPPSPTTTSASRPRPQPVVPPDFPLETPPNLRTTLPNRPVSAGRSRPGAVVTLSSNQNSETQASVNSMTRRQPSPGVSRGRLSEYAGKSRGHANAAAAADGRVPHALKSVKSSTTAPDNNGLGRTISKKSLDMAIRHMDIRNGSTSLRSVSSTTLFPQSIRTSTPKAQQTRDLRGPASLNINRSRFDIGNGTNRINGREIDEWRYFAKLSEVDTYENSLLLKEDLNNTNWLRSVDDKCDEGPIFDNGFEFLPEPFGLL